MPTIYLVQESWLVRWRALKEAEPYAYGDPPTERADGLGPHNGTPVRAFLDPGAAEAHRRSLEKAYRAGRNPFTLAEYELDELTSFDAGRLRDWLLDAGIDPPEAEDDPVAWARWWQENAERLTPEQRDRAWDGLDRLRFYHVLAFPEAEQPAGLLS
jgi:hypothetical protein